MAINMAIIGMGGMAGWHFENITKSIPEIKITGGFDIREEAKEKAEKVWGIKNYKTAEELYNDPNINLVLIATPNDVHKDYAIKCLNAGKNVICEKPVTMDAPELVEIKAAAEKSGKLFSVHQNRRWDADYLTIKKILDDGLLNKPYSIESCVHGSLRLYGWRAFKQNGGGLLFDWGIHLLDQFLDLIDSKVVSVYAHLHELGEGEVDDAFIVMLRFENRCSATVHISTNHFVPGPRWILACEDGTAVIEDWECKGRIVKIADPDEQDWTENVVYTAAGPTKIMKPRPDHTTKQIELPKIGQSQWITYYKNIVDVLENGAKPIVTIDQALRVMKVIDAAFESDKTGAAITTHI